MAYPYYAPYARPMGYYNPSIPQQDMNIQNGQQMPVQQPIQQMPMQTLTQFMQAQPTNDMIFVLGQNEAESYPVAPNATVTMWDKNQKTFYIKTANSQGIPSMQIYDFTERIEKAQNSPTEHVCKCGDKFATKEQINDLRGKIEDLTAKYEELSHPAAEKPKTIIKKAKENEE